MNINDLSDFKDFLVKEPNESLRLLEEKERNSGFPVIKRGVQDLLRTLMVSVDPEYILELGCGVGFSSILMSYYGKNIKQIHTVELKEDNLKRAKENIKEFGYEDKITTILGDANLVIKSDAIRDSYDFIFIDCAKAQYVNLWKDVRGLIKPGGIIVTDDILQNDSITRSRFLLNRRDRTIHKRMREYLHMQLNDEDFTGGLFEIDDGVTILTRNKYE